MRKTSAKRSQRSAHLPWTFAAEWKMGAVGKAKRNCGILLTVFENMKRLRSEPDAQGFWGKFGGRFVAETLIAPLEELTKAFHVAQRDRSFKTALARLRKDYSGRPTPLGLAERLTKHA